jgi:tRNA threonylcarbamoyladenosine biosynthesis protein TsaB
MSLILALDSSTDACSVALYRGGHIDSSFELAEKSHTQRLLPLVDDILTRNQCELRDLDAIAFGAGPGSFTGLRICCGIVQGLAFGVNLPVIPVSSLAAMALSFYRQYPQINLPVVATLDARMNEVYWGIYKPQSDFTPVESVVALSAECCISPSTFIADAARTALLRDGFYAVGSGWQCAGMNALTPIETHIDVYPQAKNIARLAAQDFSQAKLKNVLDAQPVYLRDSVAWKKRESLR